jgi:aromatic-L-amino-acid decarboxylase
MLAARERASDNAQADGGLVRFGRPLHVYTTEEAHTSVRKAALLAGFAARDIGLVDIDPWTRDMRADHLAQLMKADADDGGVPAMVVASLGSTGVTAFDPLPEIVETAAPYSAWIHVDAAMAGSAMLLPEQRHLFAGIEDADSISWNPHKWMGTILDTSLLYLRDPSHLIGVMSTNPSYLRSTSGGTATQYRDWGIPLGRRFRALKLWYQLRIDGPDAISARLRRDIDNAQWFAAQVSHRPNGEVLAPVRLQTVCIRHTPPHLDSSDSAALSQHNLDWVRSLNASGHAFVSPSLLDDVWMARVSIGVEATERRHLTRLLQLIDAHTTPITT